uniref:TDP43_N domain-containing protein n=1 Tax=Haemonchus contortus TaxID=6289 RepID=A0A7I5E7M3_HAECO
MSSQIGAVRSLRVFVEPADVELDDDDGLLWTSLQTAFPGCSGMYYRERGADCRSAVKFDGKKFLPPAGSWNDRQYYVAISQRCHGGMQAFGSYENASKQFERSVNAVQKILGSTVFELPHRTKKFSPRASPLREETSEEPEALDTLKTIQEREQHLLQADRKLSPLEQNFVDLAKISTAKDVIIDQQRTEMQSKTELLQKSEAESKVIQSRCEDLEARLKAMDDELNMLRKMGCEQEYLGDKVKELTSHLLSKEEELARTREEFEAKCTRLSDELREAREKSSSLALNLETATEKSSELAEQLQNAIVSRDLLSNELTQLRPLARAVDIENADGVIAYLDAVENAKRHQAEAAQAQAAVEEIKTRYDELSELQTSVINDNTRLHERNAELEAQAEKFNGEIQNLNEDWKRKLEKEKMEWDQAHREIETECAQMKKQLVDLQDVLATVTRDATENSRRAAEMQRSRDELKRALEMAELKVQEPLKRQIRTLSDDLRESELKVSELTGLVASLTADAHNSQRDIGDIL